MKIDIKAGFGKLKEVRTTSYWREDLICFFKTDSGVRVVFEREDQEEENSI